MLILLIIPEFLSKLIFSHIPTSMFWLALIIFLVTRLIYLTIKGDFRYIFNLKFERKKSTLELLKSLDEIKFNSDDTKLILSELLENEIFQKQTGIRTEIEKRKSVLRFYQEHKNQISWDTIKDAYSFFRRNNNQKVSIKYSTFEKTCLWILSVLLSFAAILFITTSCVLTFGEISKMEEHTLLLVNFVIAALSYFLSISIRNLHAAKRIKKIIFT